MEYPELEKLSSVSDEKRLIMQFLDWCTEQGYELRDWSNTYHDQPQAISKTFDQITADYLDIDLAEVEKERRALLESATK